MHLMSLLYCMGVMFHLSLFVDFESLRIFNDFTFQHIRRTIGMTLNELVGFGLHQPASDEIEGWYEDWWKTSKMVNNCALHLITHLHYSCIRVALPSSVECTVLERRNTPPFETDLRAQTSLKYYCREVMFPSSPLSRKWTKQSTQLLRISTRGGERTNCEANKIYGFWKIRCLYSDLRY